MASEIRFGDTLITFATAQLMLFLAATPTGAQTCDSAAVEWALRGSEYSVFPRRLLSDGADGLYVVGSFTGTHDFDPTDGLDVREGDGTTFVTKLGIEGGYGWTRILERTGGMYASGATAGGGGGVIIGGGFSSTIDFDPTDGVDERTAIDDPSTTSAEYNSFVSALNADGTYGWTVTFGGGFGESGVRGVAVGRDGALTVAGSFHGEVDFDPTEGP